MILVVGATGRLGQRMVPRLTARGLPVRVLTRDVRRAAGLDGVEVVAGDLRRPETLPAALDGVRTVVAAAQGFGGMDAAGVRAVDLAGNMRLIDAAAAAGVERFVLVSIHGARPDHALGLFRAKAKAEAYLRASGLAWTVVRPTAYAETWLELIGRPLVESGRTRVFGDGRNPIDFVAVDDVAAVIETAVGDPGLTGATIEVAGPSPTTLMGLVALVRDVTGVDGTVTHVPRPMLRLAAWALRPVRPVLADQVATALAMDTQPTVAPDGARRRPDPALPVTPIRDVVAAWIMGVSAVRRGPLGGSLPTG